MRLSAKATLLVGTALILSLAATFGAASGLILVDHRQQEEEAARQDAQRVADAIQADADALEATAREFQGIASLVAPESAQQDLDVWISIFRANDIDVFAMQYTDPDGVESAFAILFDEEGMAFTPIPQEDLGPGLLPEAAGDGVAWLDDTPALMGYVAAADGPFSGAMAVGRLLDEAYLSQLGQRTQVDADVQAPQADTFRVERHSTERLSATLPLRLDAGHALDIHIQDDRTVYQQGLETIGWFAMAAGAVVAGVVATTLWLLRRWVIGPVGRLSRRVEQLDPEAADVGGHDEVHRLEAGFEHLIQELQERQDRLEATNRDLSSFASVVSHDLKSPLTTMRLNASLLSEAASDEARSQQCRRLLRGMDSMQGRIDAILSYSRAGQRDVDVRPVSLDRVLRRVLDDTSGQAHEAGATIAAGSLPPVMGHGELLAQVLQNIISNALRYRRDDAPCRIRVSGAVRGDQAWISIRDNGRGFHEEEARHMMEPFVRLAGASGTQGHGIGLATCKRILERLGGTIRARGVPQVGAEFMVILPHAQRPTPAAASAAAASPDGARPKGRPAPADRTRHGGRLAPSAVGLVVFSEIFTDRRR